MEKEPKSGPIKVEGGYIQFLVRHTDIYLGIYETIKGHFMYLYRGTSLTVIVICFSYLSVLGV